METPHPPIHDPQLAAVFARIRSDVGSPEYETHAKALAERAIEREKEQRELQKRYRRKVSKVPTEYWPVFDGTPEERPALRAAAEFMRSDKLLLILSGSKGGEGKSCAAAWCVEQAGSAAEYMQAGELGMHGNFEPIFWRGMAERSLLAVNELGPERHDGSGWFAGAFCDLIDMRIANKRKTVFTTNLGGTDFMARYATGDFARLDRRWKEYGNGFFVPLKPWVAP